MRNVSLHSEIVYPENTTGKIYVITKTGSSNAQKKLFIRQRLSPQYFENCFYISENVLNFCYDDQSVKDINGNISDSFS